jgi:Icc-related predicted phosphoesterase
LGRERTRTTAEGNVLWFFTSDLHGRTDRYDALFRLIVDETPDAVLLGGDLLPHMYASLTVNPSHADFVNDVLAAGFRRVRETLGPRYPDVLLILGNDDPKFEEAAVLSAGADGLWTYVHERRVESGGVPVYGYANVPPTPFLLKDWERYDVSRFVDPGSISPEEGRRSVPVDMRRVRYATIREDLDRLAGEDDLDRAVFLFHSPPYETALDRAALDGRMVDYVPLDVHIGSIAIRRFIEARQPAATLHGHVHESARITGSWRDTIGRTQMMSGAHEGPELPLIRFDPFAPGEATRELVPTPAA